MWWAGEESKALGAKPAEPQVQLPPSQPPQPLFQPPLPARESSTDQISLLTLTEVGHDLSTPPLSLSIYEGQELTVPSPP